MDDIETVAPANLAEHLYPIWYEMEPRVVDRIGEVGLEALCIQVHRLRDAQERITEEGLIVADRKGEPTPHPAIAVEKQAQAEIRKWLSKFGVR